MGGGENFSEPPCGVEKAGFLLVVRAVVVEEAAEEEPEPLSEWRGIPLGIGGYKPTSGEKYCQVLESGSLRAHYQLILWNIDQDVL